MATAKTTGSYLDPPQLHGVLNSNGTYTLSALELKALNDFNYYVAKMMQGGLNLANLNKATNQVFEDIDGNVTAVTVTAEGLTISVSNLDNEVSTVKQTAQEISSEVSRVSTDLDTVTTEVSTVKQTAEDITSEVSRVSTDLDTVTTKVSTVEQTADGLSVMVTEAQETADSAYSKAQSVELTVDGFTVSDGYGNTTINGDKIRSGTIEGVILKSLGYGASVMISNGMTHFGKSESDFSAGGVGYEYGTGKVYLQSYDSTPLKITAYNAGISIDAQGGQTVYIGTSNNGENVSIGNSGGAVNLVGNVTVNGTPIGG